MKRRDLLGGGILGGLLGTFRSDDAVEAAEPAMAQRQLSREDFGEIVVAIDKLRQTVAEQRTFPEISQIRDAQRSFLRTNQKMPDYIEVGASLWFQLYDWHIRWQQPLNLGRDPQGRYTIQFMGTIVILRPENQDAYISAPYDVR